MRDKICYLNISDIHLGHDTNATDFIIDNLKRYFNINLDLFKKLDMIIITGDIFHKLLAPNSKEYLLANMWLADLVLFCSRYKIILRVLEGTPSHDWKQASLINSVINKLKINIDFKYVDTLYIETHPKLGIDILYIPDEYKPNAEDTLSDVKELMKLKKLKQVDVAFMHGQFNYQLPMVKLKTSHSEEEYLRLVKYYISIGHIHHRSNFERILAPGSFDRLAHKEEEPKGGYYITLYKDDMEYYFIENKEARIFKTFEYTGVDVEVIKKDIIDKMSDFQEGSNIRVLVKNNDTVLKSLRAFKSEFPLLNIKVEVKKDKDRISILPEDTKDIVSNAVQITNGNIIELLEQRMDKHILTAKQHNVFISEITEFV